MPAYLRAELEEMVQRWLQANRDGEANRDWRHLADMFTEDATYGWNVGANDEFMAVGREELRELAFGLEMSGLEGWTYPYQKVLIDDQQGEVLGLWKQIADYHPRRRIALRDRRPRRELVSLWRTLSVELATGLLRRGERRRHLHGDDQRRDAPARHATTHGASLVGREASWPLPIGEGARRLVGSARFPRSGATWVHQDQNGITAPTATTKRRSVCIGSSVSILIHCSRALSSCRARRDQGARRHVCPKRLAILSSDG